MCNRQFAHGEPRLQQLGNRDSQRADYVHATCVHGGGGHFHELLPKHPTDQDSVERVVQIRKSIIQAASDSDILLPIIASSDASTEAPPDDEPVTFGREEALRLGEDVVNFQWFDTVS